MPPKRAVRKSRMDLLLEQMDSMAPHGSDGRKPITAEELLAQSSSSSEEDEDDHFEGSDAVGSPSSLTAPSTVGGKDGGRPSQRGRRLERQGSDANPSGSAGGGSPLFLSELAILQRKKDMEIEKILLEADGAGLSKGAGPLVSLIRILCGLGGGGGINRFGAASSSMDDADRSLFDDDEMPAGPSPSALVGCDSSGSDEDNDAAAGDSTEGTVVCGKYSAVATKSLAMLRTMGTAMSALVTALTARPYSSRADLTSPTITKAYLALVRVVLAQCSTETMAREGVFAFLVGILKTYYGCEAADGDLPLSPLAPSVPKARATRQGHWSVLLNASKGEQAGGAAKAADGRAPDADDARVLEAAALILGPDAYHQVQDDAVTTAAVACELLSYVFVASNRQSIFGDVASSTGGSFIESQASDDLSSIFASPGSQGLGDGDDCRTGGGGFALFSAPIVFNAFGGFGACLAALKGLCTAAEDSSESSARVSSAVKVLALLEVATCTDALKSDPQAMAALKGVLGKLLMELFRILKALFEKEVRNEADERDAAVKELVLRVATNISSSCSDAIPMDMANAGKCAALTGAMLSHLTTGDAASSHGGDGEGLFDHTRVVHAVDGIVELVCLSINLCRRGANDNYRWAMLDTAMSVRGGGGGGAPMQQEDFSEWCVGWIASLYAVDGDASANVLAGYLALLLAMLSLDDEEARVKIVAALASHATASVQSVSSKPMTWVVALLQEFVLFQSAAQILTKEMVVAMHAVIDKVIAQNGIVVSSAVE